MSTDREIERLRERIATAQKECDDWRHDGPESKYLEAYVIVKALTLELDEKLNQPRR